MTTAWKLPTNTASYISGVTPSQAHILFDTTNNKVIFGDGSTAGGVALARATHAHVIADVTGLQTALDGKASSSHNHDGTYQPIDADLTAFAALDATVGLIEKTAANTYARRAIGVGASTSVPTRADADARYAAAAHGHAISDVTSLQTTLDGKAALSHTHSIANVTSLQATLDGKAALSHTHAIADVTSLQAALDDKQQLDGDLTAIAALAATGLAERTGTNAWATRALGVGASTSVPTRADGDARYAQLTGAVFSGLITASAISASSTTGPITVSANGGSSGAYLASHGPLHATYPGNFHIVTDIQGSASNRGSIIFGTHNGGTAYTTRFEMDLSGNLKVAGTTRLAADGSINGTIKTASVTIADDAATTITPLSATGIILVTAGTSERYSLCHFGAIASPYVNDIKTGTSAAVTTGILSGTTGADTKLTVSAASNGNVYIENRLGSSVTVKYTLISC